MFGNFKKGAIGATLTWVVAFLIIFFIMLIFITMTSFLVGQKKIPVVSWILGADENTIAIKSSESGLDYQRNLIFVLNSPVEVEGKIIRIKDLIGLWYSDKDKYQVVLNEGVTKSLNELEYEYVDSNTKNLRVRGFRLFISLDNNELFDVVSSHFNPGICVGAPCQNLAGVYIPITNSESTYVVIQASQEAKEK